MRATLTFGILASIIIAPVFAGGDDPRAIIDKAIEASGGSTNLAKHKSASWKDKGTYYGMGDGQPYTGSSAIEFPDRFRMEVDDVFMIVFDKDKGWVKSQAGVTDMTAEQLQVQIRNFRGGWIASLLPLADKGFELKSLGAVKVKDRETSAVQVSRKDYPEVKLYFDKMNHLLAKSEFRTTDFDLKKEVLMEYYYSDHRAVDGAKVPHRIDIHREGKIFVEGEMFDVRTGANDPKAFARP